MRAPLAESRLPGRLVRQDQRRVVHDGPGDRRALHLAARQLGRAMVQPMREADLARALPGPRGRFVARPAGQEQRQRDVLDQVQGREQVEELEDEAEPLAAHPREPIVGQRVEPLPVEGDRAGGWAIHRAADVQQRGLAASRRPDNRHEFPAIDRQGHVVHRRDGGIAGGKVRVTWSTESRLTMW